MNNYYDRMLSEYNNCRMTKEINERPSLISYSENNSDRFLEYDSNSKRLREVEDYEKWKPYTERKYKNIRASLETGISEIDEKEFSSSECKYCGQLKEEREIEHVLPKAHYPELAIFVPNLVCACGKCNKTKPDNIPVIDGINMYPHPRYELYNSFEVEIVLEYKGDILHNITRLKYYHDDEEIVARWNKLRDDLNLNKRISDNVVKIECDHIVKLINRGKSIEEIIDRYNEKLVYEEYSTELCKQVYVGLRNGLGNLQENT